MILGCRNCLVWHCVSEYAIDELHVNVAQGGLEHHAIATIGPRRQADDKDLLELRYHHETNSSSLIKWAGSNT